MRHSVVRTWAFVVLWALAALSLDPARGAAQDVDLASRAPRFLVESAPSRELRVVDANSIPALKRRIKVDFRGTTLERALTEISRQAGLGLMYSRAVVPLTSRVELQAANITVAAALTEVLLEAGVDVVISATGQVMITKRANVERVRAPHGTVVGRITDGKTGEAIVGADISLDGTRVRAASGEKGYYRLPDVDVGSYTLVVRRVGYAKQSRAVTVAADQEATVDVVLQPVVTQLNELITTVTGEQRRLELGHVVGVINADSLVKEAPVSTLSELLTARTPGMQVFQTQGTVGGEVRLQIRGPNSFLLNNEPLVVIDGVRYASRQRSSQDAAATAYSGSGSQIEQRSPLNDINLNDIENVEIVKGPSAATLYGTDAANGVIVITTKRGMAGAARWSFYGRATRTSIPTDRTTDLYYGYGHMPDGSAYPFSCGFFDVVYSGCIQDSIARVNPLTDDDYTIFGSKPRWEYGMNVSGGRQDIRYYFSGDFEDATGALRMPKAFVEELKANRGLDELPDEWLNPNTYRKVNLRSSLTAFFGDRADLQFNVGYINTDTRSAGSAAFNSGGSPYGGGYSNNPNAPYGTGAQKPTEAFLRTSEEQAEHAMGSTTAKWRPVSWLSTRATVGLDLTTSNRITLARRGDLPNDYTGASQGRVSDERVRHQIISTDIGATAMLKMGRVSWRTSVGSQYVRDLNTALGADGQNLPPGGTSVQQATTIQTSQGYKEAVTLGGYLEETFGLNERLFLTGAVRVDGASSFGRGYSAATYPKASASWLLSDERFFPRVPGLNELRVRYAYGASGKQPDPSWSLSRYFPTRTSYQGVVTPVIVASLGNPDLQPERVREHEAGFDGTAFGNKLDFELTWYTRRVQDQIISASLPPGFGSIYTNLGLTKQHGFEMMLTAHLLDTRGITVDMVAQHSLQRTKLISLGRASDLVSAEGGYKEGYPLGARFAYPLLGYADANADGRILFDEVHYGTELAYAGESAPPVSQSLNTLIGLFNRRLRFSALFDRRTGFTQIAPFACPAYACRGLIDLTLPMDEQAAAVIASDWMGHPRPEKADFTRLREVTVAVELPMSMARSLRVRTASLSLSARNLALWSDFSGGDPESGGTAVPGEALPGTGSSSGIPQGRTFALRVDLGL